MRVRILAIGRMKSGPESELLARYLDRAAKAGRRIGIGEISVRELPESRGQTAATRKGEEARALVAALSPGALTIALDERGDDVSSQQFAALLRKPLDDGVAEAAFLIGGPDGHGAAALAAAGASLRFGSLTWPHQIVRLLLAEQVYRAVTILSGHPYHRD